MGSELAFSKEYYFTCWVHALWLCCVAGELVHYEVHVEHPVHDHPLSIPSIFAQVTETSFPGKKKDRKGHLSSTLLKYV